ncbi:hypothetical protein [Yersinia intermedia]|nr:hypothetical protein [Yersinia intermedia]WET13869.1 hypothetical protein P2W49_14855 [Yersinia intermedia]
MKIIINVGYATVSKDEENFVMFVISFPGLVYIDLFSLSPYRMYHV